MEKKEYRKETRIWCELCKVFVYNNPQQRKKHDNSPKHAGLIKRQLQNIHKKQLKPSAVKVKTNKEKLLEKAAVDASKYGIEGTETTKDDRIYETRIGEWQEQEEEEEIQHFHPNPISYKKHSESESETEFKIEEKKTEMSETEDKEIQFKQRKKKKFRK